MPEWLGTSALNPDKLIPRKHQWQAQWRRVCRWHIRTKEIEKRSKEVALTADDEDFLIAYFQNCYHLKDWLQSSRLELKTKLKSFTNDNFEMRACRNICDGFKHKKLDAPGHPDPDFNWYREFDSFEKEIDPSKPAIRHSVAFSKMEKDGKGKITKDEIVKYDVFDLINNCHSLWEKFIKDNQLSEKHGK